jgi:hypothetical protein
MEFTALFLAATVAMGVVWHGPRSLTLTENPVVYELLKHGM